MFDFKNCRAIAVDGHEDAVVTLTTAADLASVVARAVDYHGRWPEIGGIRGNRVTFSRVIQIGEKIRGICGPMPALTRISASSEQDRLSLCCR